MNATLTQTEARPADVGPAVHHQWCCNINVAMCGEDITDHVITNGDGETPCPICELVYASEQPCPVLGCSWSAP